MQCNQLNRLVREWYIHVKNETMAPGRMMQFVDQHVKECITCRQEQDFELEIEKIREFILPESKLPKSFRTPNKTLTPEISPDVDAVFKKDSPPASPDKPKVDGQDGDDKKSGAEKT